MTHFDRTVLVLMGAWFACCTAARAEDAFYSVPLDRLNITEGKRPEPTTKRSVGWSSLLEPRAVLDGPGEALLLSSGTPFDSWNVRQETVPLTLALRVPVAREVSGWLFLPKPDFSGAERLRFTIPATDANASAKEDFYTAQLSQSINRQNRDLPGAAWYRYRAAEAVRQLPDGNPTTQRAAALFGRNRRRGGGDTLDESYALFSGGRAVSENLQLDRGVDVRAATQRAALSEDVGTIRGVEVAGIDWAPFIKDRNPAVDALAKLIPSDQHAIFFPSFAAAVNVSELVDRHGTPVLEMAETRSESADARSRLERQLGLSLGELTNVVGPTMVTSVALTGSDPYFRVGTDVAVIFQSPNAAGLRDLILSKIALQNVGSSVERTSGSSHGLDWTAFTTKERAVTSYVAAAGDAVIVSNSRKQIENIANVLSKNSEALVAAPEYTFFRDRYPSGAADETAFVILTDATIRRWCGPRWRIADSRRTRAAAALADLQAQVVDRGISDPASLKLTAETVDLGKLNLVDGKVSSSIYGSLDFMTPIVELDVDRCTLEEHQAYDRWRNQYQNYWRGMFDPIGAKLTNDGRVLAMDLSVRPLIAGSDYQQLIDVTSGVSLDADSGDPHEGTSLQWTMALNRESATMKSWAQMGGSLMGGQLDLMSWIGKSVSIYFDHDPAWSEAARNAASKPWPQRNAQVMYSPPLALRVESRDTLRLAAFLTALRAWSDQSAPGLAVWSTLKHGEQGYVKISAAPDARGNVGEITWSIYYAATPDALLITLNQDLLKRALDRRTAPKPTTSPAAQPWIGSSVAFRCDRNAVDLLAVLQMFGVGHWQAQTQQAAWKNILILNDWKRLYPDLDPADVHQRLWGVRPIDPAGGKYVWNEHWKTMESTTLGHPAAPKPGPSTPAIFSEFGFLDAGVTFEENGLRARVRLARDPQRDPTTQPARVDVSRDSR